MTTSSCGSHPFLNFTTKLLIASLRIAALTAACVAQNSTQLPDAPVSQLLTQALQSPIEGSAQEPSTEPATVTLPAGTRLQLVLTHPVDSNSTPRGDQVFAQTTAPVIVGDQVVIPGGTYVQGKVEKLIRHGTQAQMTMQSVSLVFPNGYIANAGGPVNIQSEQWTAWNNPEGRSKAAIILAPILGLGLGTGIGAATDHAHTFTLGGGSMPSGGFGVVPGPTQLVPGLTVTENSHKGLVIGSMIGGIVGGVTSLALIAHNRQFYIQEGSPMTMSLPQPLTLAREQIDDANHKAAEQPAQIPATRSRPLAVGQTTGSGTCYTPGTPGTPDVVIPGTPAIGNSPGTPPTVIPGTPPTPPMPHPCP